MKKKTPSHDDLTYPYGYHFPPDLHVAYSPSDSPKQAVLVLKTFPDTSDYRIAEDAPYKPNDYSRLAACKTMEEGWDVLRHFSATEYDDARMCPDIPQSLEEGFAEGRQYGELLKKMQDPGYLDQWLMSL
ncbi:hypothetical protein GGR51DRAFT_544540 [Nemania sp. FL0031]|nr:hypothetical protein GGR51DRAFT_544540 [Nemania sp. FL0031]